MTEKLAPGELVFAPAKPGNEAWLIAIAGPGGAGKTKSALRLARGIAGPEGTIGFADTENKRALFYAREHSFDHCPIYEPFTPAKYVTAVERSRAAGHAVLIIDSMSHEWSGLGGLLDMHEAELERMAGDDWSKREKMTYAAWIKPKAQHKAMMARLLQLNTHVIFCLRAEEKIAMEKNERGKIVPVKLGFQPVCGKDFMFDMTVAFMLSDQAPGVPVPMKTMLDKHRQLFDMQAKLDEAAGARIAAYARGDALPAAAPAPEPQQQKPASRGAGKTTREAVQELIARFEATTTRREHFKIVDDENVRKRMHWLQSNRPEAFEAVTKAIEDSFYRTGLPGAGSEPNKEMAA